MSPKIALFLVMATGLIACSHDRSMPTKLPLAVVDSAYTICKDVYFWNENLPNITKNELSEFADTKEVIEKIKSFSQLHNGRPLDRWSFLIDKSEWQKIEQNQAYGFGFNVAFTGNDDLRIKVVYPQSNCYKAGLRRGHKVLKINNVLALSANKDLIASELKKSEITLEFQSATNQIETKILKQTEFQKDALINLKILDGKVGYFYFDIFLGGSRTYQQLEEAFKLFKQANIKDLVIDLRYNRGGDGSIAQYLANNIIPQTGENKVFTRVINNKKYSLLNYSLYFKTTANNLNLSRVFFITTQETASSSEVLINSLKPVMDVKTVGISTQGKPFGFIPYSVGNNYIFPVAFKNVNSNGYGEYYEGITPNLEVNDDITFDFGDSRERCLQNILYYIDKGQFMPRKMNGRIAINDLTTNEAMPFFLSKPH